MERGLGFLVESEGSSFFMMKSHKITTKCKILQYFPLIIKI